MSAEFLVGLIITLVAGSLLMWTAYSKLAKADEKQAEVICQESIAARATFALQVNTKESGASKLIEARVKTVPPLCKTIDKKIKGSREEIKKQMADKLARCWWMFGEGRYEEILHSSDLYLAPVVFGMDNEPNKCFNCYNVLIDQDEIPDGEKNKGDITVAEFVDYLWTTPYRQKALSCEGADCVSCTKKSDCASDAQCENGQCQIIQSLNYIQYVQQYAGPGMFVSIVDQSIKPRHGYAISILPKTKEKEQTNWVKWTGITAMGASFLGATACTILSGGACAPVLLGVLGSTAVVGGKLAVTGVGYELIQGEYRPGPAPPGVESTTLDRGTELSIETMFEERGYSSIYLSDIQTGQRFCGSGDLAGE